LAADLDSPPDTGTELKPKPSKQVDTGCMERAFHGRFIE